MPEVRTMYAQSVVESYRQGMRANVDEALLLGKRWPFRVEDLAFERVFLWHGEQDRIMSVGPARLLARALPHCSAQFYANTGHLSTVVLHVRDILSALSSAAEPTPTPDRS